MVTAILVLLIALLITMVIVSVKLFMPGGDSTNQEIVLLKEKLNDLMAKQLEAQNTSLRSQQELFNQSQKLMNEQLKSIMQLVNENLTKTQSNINTQLSNTGRIVNEVHKKLGSLEESTKNIQDIGRDISSLQDILQAPKLRGNLGEYLLEDLLKQIFPSKNFDIKYSFKDGTQVDAVIKLGQGIVPVDAKFPLESFQRLIGADDEETKRRFKREFIKSVKERIDEIAGKYINPDEGTFDFAMMYIPAENVFYEVIINDSLTGKDYEIFNYAIQRHVIPVSPNSFYAYLMAIAYGLKGFRIEQQAKLIIGELSKVQDSFGDFYGDFTLIGRHISNASKKFDDSLKKADRFNDKVSRITGLKMDLIESDADTQLPEE
jgi:DNA recombination protein RmuC